ncbi:hypothetical protein CVIC12175_0992 [Campylobacter vicugnae]|nr:hypothetical protein CVIC12175_0992 [Campylobacter sp. RM12175]
MGQSLNSYIQNLLALSRSLDGASLDEFEKISKKNKINSNNLKMLKIIMNTKILKKSILY